MAERWKAKPKGFKTVRRGGWWVRPEEQAPRGTPRGGTPSGTPRSDALNRLPPREFVGSEGLQGPWRGMPRLNPDAWEIAQNPENNRWFARPRTELTGLPTYARADIQGFDRATQASQQAAQQVYGTYAQQAAADAAAGAANLGTLAKASAAGYTDTVAGQASGPYGSIPAPALSQAERALPGVLAQGAREGSAAQSAQTIAALNQLPTLARDAGAAAFTRIGQERGGERAERIQGYRELEAEEFAAAQEAQFNRAQLEATLQIARGEQATSRRGQTLDARTADKDRLAKLRTEKARLQTQLQIARENNLEKRADRIAKRIESIEKAERAAKKITQADRRAWTKRAREMWDGIPRTVTEEYDAPGPDGTTVRKKRNVTEYLQYDRGEIIRELMAMGAPRSEAVRTASQVGASAAASRSSGSVNVPSLGWR